MIILKILAAPVMVALSLLAAMVTFLFCVASAVCELGCISATEINETERVRFTPLKDGRGKSL